MNNKEFEEWMEGKIDYWAKFAIERHEFDDSDLSRQFVPYFRTGQRIRVRKSSGEEATGIVGTTTGYKPSFLLLRRSTDLGSSNLLTDEDRIIAVQKGNKYVEVAAS